MRYIIAVLGFVLLSVALWDAFEEIISPRRVTHRFRFTRAFYRSSWWLWSAVARSIADQNRRETYLGTFGPLSLVMLLGVWATAIVAGFAMMHWGLETPLSVAPGIRDPFNGEILGGLDISGLAKAFNPYWLGLAMTLARSIEERVARRNVERRCRLIE